eukprot:TRINITY_DN25220_c0_g1_i1.p1 TRINITY_DN25220_c0_g1~~TRINITY_DN25220_c0_g1_i1.p1  ORF type:complete len:350 (+),score=103.33 TRINITY_DN25220_c0_g1_i1:64-1113(+)
MERIPHDALVHLCSYVGCHRALVALGALHSNLYWSAADDEVWWPLCRRELDKGMLERAEHDRAVGVGWCGWRTLYSAHYQRHVMRKVVGFIKTAVMSEGVSFHRPIPTMELSGLITLDLSNTCIGQTGTERLCSALKGNHVMESLDLSDQLMKTAVSSLVEVLLSMPRLRYVNLSGNRLGPQGALSVKRMLESGALTRLDLKENYFGAEGAAIVASGIVQGAPAKAAVKRARPAVPAVHRLALTLDNNNIRDDGFAALAAKAHALRSLSVKDNALSKVGLAQAVAFLEAAPGHFETLDVSNAGSNPKLFNQTKGKWCDALERACARDPPAKTSPNVVYSTYSKDGCLCM